MTDQRVHYKVLGDRRERRFFSLKKMWDYIRQLNGACISYIAYAIYTDRDSTGKVSHEIISRYDWNYHG